MRRNNPATCCFSLALSLLGNTKDWYWSNIISICKIFSSKNFDCQELIIPNSNCRAKKAVRCSDELEKRMRCFRSEGKGFYMQRKASSPAACSRRFSADEISVSCSRQSCLCPRADYAPLISAPAQRRPLPFALRPQAHKTSISAPPE